jgi:hypothetical protein
MGPSLLNLLWKHKNQKSRFWPFVSKKTTLISKFWNLCDLSFWKFLSAEKKILYWRLDNTVIFKSTSRFDYIFSNLKVSDIYMWSCMQNLGHFILLWKSEPKFFSTPLPTHINDNKWFTFDIHNSLWTGQEYMLYIVML